jgi:cytochrome c oxidase subunit 3
MVDSIPTPTAQFYRNAPRKILSIRFSGSGKRKVAVHERVKLSVKASSDKQGVKLGMWLFLYTEIMLFGGLFVLYAAYYARYTADFIESGRTLDLLIGALNTVILLSSSFTVAASITAIRRQSKKIALGMLGVSIFFGFLFLFNKYIEWGHKFEVGIYPGSQALEDAGYGSNIFYGLYYVITGLHGLHIVIGLMLLTVSFILIIKERIHVERFAVLENSGLYWHLVDLIWIFIFPLFYLVL